MKYEMAGIARRSQNMSKNDVTLVLLIAYFIAPASAESPVKNKYLEFSNQKEKAEEPPVNFATLKYPSTGNLPLNGFTICGSSRIGYFRHRQAFYTLRRDDHSDLWFSLHIFQQDVSDQTYRPVFAYNGDEVYPNTGAKLSLRPHAWSHACTTINRSSGHVSVIINGQMLINVTLDKYILDNAPSDLQNSLVLGVSQFKSLGRQGKNFQSEASVANINIFSIPKSIETMIDLTSDEPCTTGDFLSWADASWNMIGNVQSFESNDVCFKSHFRNLYLLPKIFNSQSDCLNLCPRFQEGGRVPLTTNQSDSEHLAQQYRNMSHDYARENDHIIWSSFVYETDKHFVDFYTKVPMSADLWKSGQPNGGETQQCTDWFSRYLYGDIHDEFCTLDKLTRLRCVCQFDKPPILRLRGLCKSSKIDTHYTPKYYPNGTIYYLGVIGTEIRYEKALWRLKINVENSNAFTTAEELSFTLGKQVWTIKNDTEKCHNKRHLQKMLKMSGCSEGQFTCNNGDCVKMKERCDQMLNCKDGSDEKKCQTVVLEDSYRKVAPPALLGADNEVIPASVEVSLTLLDISAIREAANEIDIKFTIELMWTEPRATYHNLKEKTSLNILEYSEASLLWVPNLIYRNNKDNDDIESSITKSRVKIVRKGNFTRSGLESVDEIEVFKGEDNPLILVQSYTKSFKCTYSLLAFPFDTQVIEIFLMHNKTY